MQKDTLHKEIYINENSKKLVLLIHGVIGSPNYYKEYIEGIKDNGYDIKAIRLPGHGFSGNHFAFTSSKKWYQYVEDTILSNQMIYDEVIVVGHSLGGLLALKFATRFALKKIVIWSAPLKLVPKKQKNQIIASLKDNEIYYLKHIECWGLNNNKPNKVGLFMLFRLASVLSIMKKVKKKLGVINANVLGIFSENDEVCSFSSLAMYSDGLTNSTFTKLPLSKSTHCYLPKDEMDLVCQKSLKFFAE